MPVAGRPRWSWLLGTGLRRWRLARTLRPLVGRVPSHAVVLDAGSGPGYDAAVLAELLPPRTADRWLLVDPQPGMIAEARRALRDRAGGSGGWSLAVASAAALPLRDDSVDVLLLIGVVCCMDEAAVNTAVLEARRVVRREGWVLLGVPSRRLRRDLASFERAGFAPVARPRRGAALLQKRR